MDQVREDRYRWVVLAMGVFAVFGALGLARFGYSAVLPAMQAGLGMTNTQAGIMATANLIGYLVLSAIGGVLASHFGVRLVVSLGLLVAAAGMIFTGMADAFSTAVFWRIVTGLGSGAANVSVMGLWAAWFSTKRRGTAAGIAVTGSSIGLMFTGPAVPAIVRASGGNGWRACWFLFGAIAVALAVLSYLLIRNRPGGASRETARETGITSGDRLVARVYRSWPVWHLGLVYIAFGFSYIIYMTFFVKYLGAERGYGREAAGRLFMIMGVFSLACGLVWGGLSDLIGRKNTLAIIYLIQTASYLLFGLAHGHALLVISAVLFGLTAWSIPAIMAATCGDVLGPKLAPAGLGFITLFFGIGQAVAPGVAGALADATGSFSTAFLLAALAAFLGALSATMLRTTTKVAPGSA
jgi:MFS family permease